METDVKFPTLLKYSKTLQSEHAFQAFKCLDLMRREGRFTDVILEAEGQQFAAHKSVLCACSPYFDRMFQPGFVEQENKIVVLKDFDSATLSILLDFIYTSKITISEENAQDVLIGANLLLLQNVKEAAADVLIKLIDDNNVFSIRTLGNMFVCREMEIRANKYINERFEFVSQSDDFKKLDVDDVVKLLRMNDIIVKCEESVFNILERWVLHNKEERTRHLDKLLATVRLPLLSEAFLETLLKQNDLIKKSDTFCKSVEETLKLKQGQGTSGSSSSSSSSSSSTWMQQNQYRRSNQLLFLQGTSTSSWFVIPPVLYDFEKSSWCTFKIKETAAKHREDSTFISHAGIIYCIEGQFQHSNDPSGASSIDLQGQVYTLSLESRKLEAHSKLNIPRKRHQSVLIGDRCYVIGGSLANSMPTSSVEYLDLGTGSTDWEEAAPMLTKRVSHMAVEVNGCIYVIGGWNGQGMVKNVEQYNPKTDKWSVVSEYEDIRMKSGVAVLDGLVYLVGGCVQTLETCYQAETFDPETKTWKQIPRTHFARSNPVLAPYRGKLYVFGGEGNSYGQVECFDPTTQKWTVLSTAVKHFVNGFYSGCMIEKPWDFDMHMSKESHLQERILSSVGLEAVKCWQTMWS